MKIRYNAPVTLTFAILCALLLVIDLVAQNNVIPRFFMVPGRGGFSLSDPLDLFRLVSHIAGHGGWNHLLSNFAFILLLGPILEEKYTSGAVLVMMVITAVVTGLLNVMLFTTGLLGASGIVFMMILLTSFTNIRQGEIPLTFILVVALFLAREIIGAVSERDNISQFTHIAGGVCGSMFGFFRSKKWRSG